MNSNGNGATGNGSAGNGAAAASLPAGDSHDGANGLSTGPVATRLAGAGWVWSAGAPPSATTYSAADEAVDVGALVRTLRRGWRALLVGALLGVAAGLAVVAFFPARYRALASVLVRNANDPAGSLLSRFGLAGELAGGSSGGGGGGGGALGGVLKSPIETEVQLLQTRELIGHVVDSLALQARVLAPTGVPARALFAPGPIGGSFRPREATFTREGDGRYRVQSAEWSAVVSGGAVSVPGIGMIRLAVGPLPPTFRVEFVDREDAITHTDGRLTVEKKGGELVDVRFSGPDSLTAANVANTVVTAYLEQRRTVDRGINQRRFEFMAAQADSAARQLAAAENALRREQESSGVVDPEATGRSELEGIQQVRNQLIGLESERQAAHSLVDAVERGSLSPRQLAAFPTFLRASAINSILQQITTLETERTRLLGVRTERDPDVVVLSRSISDLERGLLPLSRTYAGSLDRQADELLGEQRAVEARLARLPGQAEGALRGQRDVKRLSQTVLGLQAQMIDARLSAISEGGQVRQVDVAQPPKRPLFPRAVYTVPGGLILGVLGAITGVLARGAWSSRVQTAEDAERAAGTVALAFHAGEPLLLGAGAESGTLLAVGADPSADTSRVAESLAAQARSRGRKAATLDATARRPGREPASGGDVSALRAALLDAEAEHDAVYVAAPTIADVRTAALVDQARTAAVVARTGVTTREDVARTTQTLLRLGIPVLGVVVIPRRE